MVATGFTNSFTAGEISQDAWDRTDLQPIAKGCAQAINLAVRVAGPLGKRRGFWRLGDVLDPTKHSRLVPFRRSIDDALMLEFADGQVRVWNNDGSVLLDDPDPVIGAPVIFASPYGLADLDGLRWKQVEDVIYLRHRDGLAPHTLTRNSNISWTFALESFPDGPWRTENVDRALTLTVSGTAVADNNAEGGGAGAILVGESVDLLASAAVFVPGHVGARFRLRAGAGSPSVKSWSVGYRNPAGQWCVSAGRVYDCLSTSSHDETVTNPPTQTEGEQTDGGNLWNYIHDGGGIVEITAVTDDTHAVGIVRKTLPLNSGEPTSYFAEAAYSSLRGWPRMWPALREERLAGGATADNLDMLDLTQTAGFQPTSETYTPGLGTGQVVATDAVRRRVGVGAELLWAEEAGYLLVGSAGGEYLVAGSVLDEAISPSAVVVKGLSEFGSADVKPVKAHTGLIFVARGGKTLREIVVDTGQNAAGEDLSVLAGDLVGRGVAQLAWVPQPDDALWVRLADGGLTLMTYHKEQKVRGFTRMSLGGSFGCEDLAVLPGPGRQETLWMIVHRSKGGLEQRCLWMLSRVEDALFVDGADLYAGAPVTTIGGLDHYAGEGLRALADGVQVDALFPSGGVVTLPKAAARVMIGLPYAIDFLSLKLDRQLGGELLQRQRVVGCAVSLLTAGCTVAIDGFAGEQVMPRQTSDTAQPLARRTTKAVTLAGDSDRDPRIRIVEDSAYDFVLYSLKPKVDVGG